MQKRLMKLETIKDESHDWSTFI